MTASKLTTLYYKLSSVLMIVDVVNNCKLTLSSVNRNNHLTADDFPVTASYM